MPFRSKDFGYVLIPVPGNASQDVLQMFRFEEARRGAMFEFADRSSRKAAEAAKADPFEPIGAYGAHRDTLNGALVFATVAAPENRFARFLASNQVANNALLKDWFAEPPAPEEVLEKALSVPSGDLPPGLAPQITAVGDWAEADLRLIDIDEAPKSVRRAMFTVFGPTAVKAEDLEQLSQAPSSHDLSAPAVLEKLRALYSADYDWFAEVGAA